MKTTIFLWFSYDFPYTRVNRVEPTQFRGTCLRLLAIHTLGSRTLQVTTDALGGVEQGVWCLGLHAA